MLFVLSDFDELEPRAWIEDAKTGLELGFLKHSAWKRSAIVTDAEWVTKAFRMFAWMAPGEVKVYGLDQEEEARAWVVGLSAAARRRLENSHVPSSTEP